MKSTCVVDVLDFFFSFDYLKALLGEDTLSGGELDMVRQCRKKMEPGLQKISQPQASHACCIPIFVAKLDIVRNHIKRGPAC